MFIERKEEQAGDLLTIISETSGGVVLTYVRLAEDRFSNAVRIPLKLLAQARAAERAGDKGAAALLEGQAMNTAKLAVDILRYELSLNRQSILVPDELAEAAVDYLVQMLVQKYLNNN